jgi:hypothetical protein
VSHDLRKFQWAETSIGGADGDPSPRDRGIAVLNTDVAADTTISTSTNATGTFLDYSGVTFSTDVEIHINGVLMRCGASAGADFDVYPAGVAANGDFACEFNLIDTDVIQMFIGGGGAATSFEELSDTPDYAGNVSKIAAVNSSENAIEFIGQKMLYHLGGAYNGAVQDQWYGVPQPSMWITTTAVTNYGSGADPVINIYHVLPAMPFPVTLTKLTGWYRVSSATMAGDLRIQKFIMTDASPIITSSTLKEFAIPMSVIANVYELDDTLSSSNTLAAGECFSMFYRNTTAAAGFMYASLTLVLEIS